MKSSITKATSRGMIIIHARFHVVIKNHCKHMKKLIMVLLTALSYPSVTAQVELEGKFDPRVPQAQVWDGRYLAYTFRDDAYFYDTETDMLYIEPEHQIAYMNFREGVYLRKVDEKYQLRKLGEEEPLMPYLLTRFTGWFGNSFMGWEEVTGPNAGIYAVWYDFDEGVIARHKLEDLHRAVGLDPKNSFLYRDFNLNLAGNIYSFQYREGVITLRNPETDKFGFFDLELNRAFPGEFDGADPFFEGLAAAQNEDGLWGFIDTSGETQIPFIYRQKPGPFHSGLARVVNHQGRMGFIDKNGELKIPANYQWATYFYKGKAIAMRAGPGGYQVFLKEDGEEEKFPCKNCLTQYSTYGSRMNTQYFPRQDIRDFMDDGMAIFKRGFQAVIVNRENEEMTPVGNAMLKDLVDGKVLMVVGDYLGNDKNQQFYLWDLASNKPAIRLSFTEF